MISPEEEELVKRGQMTVVGTCEELTEYIRQLLYREAQLKLRLESQLHSHELLFLNFIMMSEMYNNLEIKHNIMEQRHGKAHQADE